MDIHEALNLFHAAKPKKLFHFATPSTRLNVPGVIMHEIVTQTTTRQERFRCACITIDASEQRQHPIGIKSNLIRFGESYRTASTYMHVEIIRDNRTILIQVNAGVDAYGSVDAADAHLRKIFHDVQGFLHRIPPVAAAPSFSPSHYNRPTPYSRNGRS